MAVTHSEDNRNSITIEVGVRMGVENSDSRWGEHCEKWRELLRKRVVEHVRDG